MIRENLSQYLAYASAGSGIVSAGLWFMASLTTVKTTREEANQPGPARILTDTNNPNIFNDDFSTQQKRSRYNAMAALVSGLAMILQALALYYSPVFLSVG